MTKTAAVVFADGCEEIEGLTVVDVLRRMGVKCDIIGLNKEINGAHQIKFAADGVVSDQLLDYDMVAYPGGYENATTLRDNEQLKAIMTKRQAQGKWCAAMCAAPIAFARYGMLDGHDYTCYPGMEKDTQADAPTGHFKEQITVTDPAGHLVTSRGPATAWAYAFAIAEALGLDTKQIKQDTLYDYLKANI